MRGALKIAASTLLAALVACTRDSEPAVPAVPAAPDSWTVTWAAAPQTPLPGTADSFEFKEPIRLIVRTSVGGERVRIRLSNLFGKTPLQFNDVRVALRVQGSKIDPATEHKLTFAGALSLTLAPGKEAASDPVEFELPAFVDLAVTFLLANKEEETTTHFLALQSSFRGAPNADPGAGFVNSALTGSWPYLTGVDVQTKGGMTVVIFGDSTVDGDGSTRDENKRWPDFLARRFNSGRAPVGVANLGLIGNRLLADSPEDNKDFGTALGRAGVVRLANDLERMPPVSCVILRIGVNDIGFPGSFASGDPPMTSGQLIEGYRRAAAAARAKGARVIGTTITPFEGTEFAGYYTAAKDAVRSEVNAWMRTTRDLDGVIDADAVLRDPAKPTRLLAAFDSGDHLHPNDAGNERMAAETPVDICTRDAAPPR